MEFSNFTKGLAEYGLQPTKHMTYGTAGFRDKWKILHSTLYRMGILSCLRSLSLGSKFVGIMITASHNDECDNGVKLVDSSGGMLSQVWEPYAELLANTATVQEFLWAIDFISDSEQIDRSSNQNPPVVIIGRDTRPHSLELSKCVLQGIQAYSGNAYDFGEVTTGQLHHFVYNANQILTPIINTTFIDKISTNYYETIGKGFVDLVSSSTTCSLNDISIPIIVDVAAGVGGLQLKKIITYIQSVAPSLLQVDIRNDIGSTPVNFQCGAEHVQKKQIPPAGVSREKDANTLACSFDGDADRIVFHAFLEGSAAADWVLLDGDKIAVLLAVFIKQQINAASLIDEYSIGVVQTAYANGASTQYLQALGIEVVVAKTGVKYLHPKAEEFDVGVYFEANGHGTVLFSHKLQSYLEGVSQPDLSTPTGQALHRLKACFRVINQAVGDAISDMLSVLAILQVTGQDASSWHGMYKDLPSKQLKVSGLDKSKIICSEDECRVVSPTELQNSLTAAMTAIPKGRCFVRPSGTEDVVRVYAEAETQSLADKLADDTVQILRQHVGV